MNGLTRAIGVRPGEARTIALVALLFASLEAGRGFGEIGVDTLVVSRFGAGSLPYLFIGLGTASFVAALAYGAALGRLPRIPLLAGVPIGAAVVLLVERLLMATDHPATVPLAWLTVYAVGTIGVTIAWTMAGSVFDARQAKRLFPLCTGAAIAGSFFGTLLSGPVARAVGTPTLIVLEAILLIVVGALVVGVSRTTTVRVPTRRADRSIVDNLRAGFDEVVRSPLMRLVAIAYVLLSILMFSVTYPFLLAASETFHSEADLATVPGPAVGGRDGHLVRRLDRAGEPGLREVRRGRRRPAAAARVPRRASGSGWCPSRSPPRPSSGSPSRSPSEDCRTPPGARSTTWSRPSGGPRCSPSTTGCPTSSARSCRASSSWRPARSWCATRCSGSGR